MAAKKILWLSVYASGDEQLYDEIIVELILKTNRKRHKLKIIIFCGSIPLCEY
jgi:hypothetical protein